MRALARSSGGTRRVKLENSIAGTCGRNTDNIRRISSRKRYAKLYAVKEE